VRAFGARGSGADRQLWRDAAVARTLDSLRHLLNREHLAKQCADQPERIALHLDWIRAGRRGAVAEEEHLDVAGMCFPRCGVAAHIGRDTGDDDRLRLVGTENLIEVGTEECSEARLRQDDVAWLDDEIAMQCRRVRVLFSIPALMGGTNSPSNPMSDPSGRRT
jgi:hypothetical protein